MDYEFAQDHQGNPYLKVALSGFALITNPLLNKGTAFSKEERVELDLLGIIPPEITNIGLQTLRSYEAYRDKPTDIEKYIYLRDLQDSNETLFYHLLLNHIEEMLPIVYTPTVGLGCQRYSHIYRRPRGLFISYPDKDSIEKILANPRFDRTKVIVVSDGERILGLGDQGAGGMGIPIGKLALYSACAGIHPADTLPILLDTGTNNLELQNDPLYIGWHHERIRGIAYDEFIETFVQAVKKRFPHVLLQWEDFAKQNANPILDRYRDQLCTFNDDIQGTAAIAAGTLFAAIQISGTPLQEQRIVVVGAGSAGCGICHLIKKAMIEAGLSEAEARNHFYLIDQTGLLTDDMKDLQPFQRVFAHKKTELSQWKLNNPQHVSLDEVVHHAQPTLLIGVSGQSDIFTKKIIEEMSAHVERPIIFPLSNPTSCAEATPSDLLIWTHDKAIISTGSPFPPVSKNGKTFKIDQTNNSYIFPGVGLGLIAVQAKCVTDNMFMAAAKALAECSPARQDTPTNLLPPMTYIRDVSLQIALAVAEEAVKENLAHYKPNKPLEEYIRELMWSPNYIPYKRYQSKD